MGVAQAKRDGLSWVEGTKQYEIELSAAYQMCREGMIMPLKIGTDENPADDYVIFLSLTVESSARSLLESRREIGTFSHTGFRH